MNTDEPKQVWLQALSVEDLAFLRRFLLASGSLKKVAAEYGISYPTVRLRLDRLIQKVRVVDDQSITSEFERSLRILFAEGKIDAGVMATVLKSHNQEIRENSK